MCERLGKIGDYQVVGIIASTGNAHLYQAVECINGQNEKLPYVLKELKKDISESVTLKKEKEITHYIEIQSRKSILIPVLKVIREGEKEFAVMQLYHHGKILSECIEELEIMYGRGCIPLRIQLQLLCTILESLQELHTCIGGNREKGYLHLDLHPGNIFLENCDIEQGQFGTAKFLDFQNALKTDAEGKARGDMDMMGATPGFAAPEQYAWGGSAAGFVCSEATDLYAAAAIGARMFTGRRITGYMTSYLELVEEEILTEKDGVFLSEQFARILRLGLSVNSKYRFRNVPAMKQYLYSLMERLTEAERGEYYQLFSSAYKALIPLNQMSPGKMIWHSSGFRRAVRSLRNEMDRQDHDTARSHYIFCGLWNMSEFFGNQISAADRQELALCGIESYNYLGDSNHAAKLFDWLQNMQTQLSVMEYLKLINIASEFYVDTFRYETALLLMEKNIEAFEKIRQVYREVALTNNLDPDAASRMKEYARTCMNYGRYLAYLHREGGAAYLQKALEEFDEEDDRQITLSHILHCAIEEKDQKLFECYVREYLGVFLEEKSAADILYMLMEQAEDGTLWRVWIFLKGMYQFYMPLLSGQEREDFCQVLCLIMTDYDLGRNGAYPAEHIYKYIALILWDESERDEDMRKIACKAFMSALACPKTEQIDKRKPLTIRMLMKYQMTAVWLNKCGEETSCNELRDALLEHSRRSGWNELVTVLEQGHSLWDILGYEHC